MAEQKTIRDRKRDSEFAGDYLEDGEQATSGAQEVLVALRDFQRDRSSGVIEIHLSQGGIAKVFSKVTRTYK